ncbi:PDZ and LIM domain protein 7 isoform 7-T7 [Alca torda]
MLMDLGCVSNHSVGWSGWSYHWKCDLSPPALSCQAPGPLLACSPCVVSAYPNTRITPSSLAEMGDMESYKVMLNGPAPWGFRLQGGKDFSMPLSISRLTPGGKAAQAGVGVGDWVLYIDGESTSSMTHIEAQNRIRACGDRLSLTLSRAQNHLGKPQKVSVLDPSPGAAMKTEPGLAPRTPAATPGPASRPPWAVDPSFAERYAPDKTSTVVSKHSQPATPTPMQNRSSIVQAAQQAPEGPGRTPLCYKCNKVIRGRYLVALGHYYHPEEFICCQCRKVLDEGGFFEEKGSIFCPKCYDMRYAPSCAKCKKKITGEVMHALKMTWHVQCFTCAACKTPIRNRAFYMEEGQPYCERGRTRGPHMAPGTVGAQHLTVWVGGELPCAVGLSPGHGEGRDPAPVAPEPSVPVLCGCWVVPSLPRCHGDDGGCTSKTMRRCLAPSAAAATSRLTLGTGSWRRWGSAGTTLASSVRSARPTWKGRRSTPRRTSRSARATLSPTCEGREFSCAHACPWPCMLLSPSPAAPREPGWALTPSPCSCLFPDSSWPSSSRG